MNPPPRVGPWKYEKNTEKIRKWLENDRFHIFSVFSSYFRGPTRGGGFRDFFVFFSSYFRAWGAFELYTWNAESQRKPRWPCWPKFLEIVSIPNRGIQRGIGCRRCWANGVGRNWDRTDFRHRVWPGEGSTVQWKWSPPAPGSLKALLSLHPYRGEETIYLHRSGPLLENGLDRPENRYGRYGFAGFYSISISTVGVDGARVCLWRFYFLALWVVVVDICQFPTKYVDEFLLCKP